eukprot:symbB.v1.2.018021.t1/scaffold1374.1/size123604/3
MRVNCCLVEARKRIFKKIIPARALQSQVRNSKQIKSVALCCIEIVMHHGGGHVIHAYMLSLHVAIWRQPRSGLLCRQEERRS